jgi:hypothetical protein
MPCQQLAQEVAAVFFSLEYTRELRIIVLKRKKQLQIQKLKTVAGQEPGFIQFCTTL